MALQCTFCGTALKDDARYCNHCGTLVASHPFSPKSTSSSTSPVEQANTAKEPLREQIVQQPPYRSHRRSKQEEPPSWLSQLEDGLNSKAPSGALGPEKNHLKNGWSLNQNILVKRRLITLRSHLLTPGHSSQFLKLSPQLGSQMTISMIYQQDRL